MQKRKQNTKPVGAGLVPAQNKGITLIALIITIIVMLILVGVTINVALNGGLFQKAEIATKQTQIAADKEELQIEVVTAYNEETGEVELSTLKTNLEAKGWNVTVSGENATCASPKGNAYKVEKSGSISGPIIAKELSLIEKYILGNDGSGKNLFEEICDDEFNFYGNEELGIEAGDVTLVSVNDEELIIYIKYSSNIYKFKVSYDENGDEAYVTEENYGLVKVYEQEEGTRVGKTVSYDNKLWTVLYDDSTNGLQMISQDVQAYNDESFYLGFEDSLIKDWDSLTSNADLDKNESLDNFEKSVYSYNNAIKSLNAACESIIAPSEGNIIDVRSVGSNPINKDSESTTYSKYDERGKEEDENYMFDYERMIALGIGSSDGNYWLASRWVDVESDMIYFKIRYSDSLSFYADDNDYVWRIYNGVDQSNSCYRGLRPVVLLSSNIQFEGEGTQDNPYTF